MMNNEQNNKQHAQIAKELEDFLEQLPAQMLTIAQSHGYDLSDVRAVSLFMLVTPWAVNRRLVEGNGVTLKKIYRQEVLANLKMIDCETLSENKPEAEGSKSQ